jgi:ribonucleoside-diphosphate reductase beta chain
MASEDPELAARLLVQVLPAAAADLKGPLRYGLSIDGFGTFHVEVNGGPAQVRPAAESAGQPLDFVIEADAKTLAELGAGGGLLPALASRRLRVKGNRRKAMALRKLSPDAGLRDAAKAGVLIDPDAVHRSLAYVIDGEWTRGHSFCVSYELTGEGGGTWYVHVDDGTVRVDTNAPAAGPDSIVRLSVEDWRRLLAEELTPAQAMYESRTEVLGDLYAVTLLGRWIDRADGRDDPELEREACQAELQRRRAGSWGSRVNGAAPGMGDPAHDAEEKRRSGGGLLSYQELYALWERQNWRLHELDFERDKLQWLATPTEAQDHTKWSMGSFYVGEERVTADLAPFLLAAPSGEVEVFLSTQLVDEARHAAFFDRWAAEVMVLSSDDLRGRLREMEEGMLGDAWHAVFDDALRDVANRIKAKPDDLELFVEGITTYHMVIEGVLAMTGQRTILQYTADHAIYPGFNRGFSLVEQDEHRHIAFGVRFLKDVCEERPEMRKVVERTVIDLVPRAVHVFIPPYGDPDPADFTSYGFHSSQIYGYAYKALKRRMGVIGIEVPPAEDLMPGPVDLGGLPSGKLPTAA